jgi:hypothetical protein
MSVCPQRGEDSLSPAGMSSDVMPAHGILAVFQAFLTRRYVVTDRRRPDGYYRNSEKHKQYMREYHRRTRGQMTKAEREQENARRRKQAKARWRQDPAYREHRLGDAKQRRRQK